MNHTVDLLARVLYLITFGHMDGITIELKEDGYLITPQLFLNFSSMCLARTIFPGQNLFPSNPHWHLTYKLHAEYWLIF